MNGIYQQFELYIETLFFIYALRYCLTIIFLNLIVDLEFDYLLYIVFRFYKLIVEAYFPKVYFDIVSVVIFSDM